MLRAAVSVFSASRDLLVLRHEEIDQLLPRDLGFRCRGLDLLVQDAHFDRRQRLGIDAHLVDRAILQRLDAPALAELDAVDVVARVRIAVRNDRARQVVTEDLDVGRRPR